MVLLDLNITRDHDHDGLRLFALDLAQNIESGAVWKIDIEQNCGW